MNCVQCDEETEGARLRVGGDYVCSMTCAREYERLLKESMRSMELLQGWVDNSLH